jgi:sRNA-binding protein
MGPRLVIAIAMITAGLAACGPIAYVAEVRRADDAVTAARHAEAEKHAPYWWTRAREYLHKARVTAARADFQGANRFGRLATEAAQQAVLDAQDPSKRPIDPDAPEPAAPAKGRPAAPSKDPPAAPAKDAPAAPAKEPTAPAQELAAPPKDPPAAPAKDAP